MAGVEGQPIEPPRTLEGLKSAIHTQMSLKTFGQLGYPTTIKGVFIDRRQTMFDGIFGVFQSTTIDAMVDFARGYMPPTRRGTKNYADRLNTRLRKELADKGLPEEAIVASAKSGIAKELISRAFTGYRYQTELAQAASKIIDELVFSRYQPVPTESI